MSLNYHNAPQDIFHTVFKKRCEEASELLATMESIFDSRNVSLVELGPEVAWNIFQFLMQTCDTDMMRWLKDNQPETYQQNQIDLFSYPNTAQMADDICKLKEAMQAVSENMERITKCLDNLTSVVMEMVPPPAEAPGIDDQALHSEYCLKTPAAVPRGPGSTT